MKKYLKIVMSWKIMRNESIWSLSSVYQLVLVITMVMLSYNSNAQFYNGYKVSSNTHSAFFKSLIEVESGGYVVAGYTPESGPLDRGAIMRFNDQGEVKWLNSYTLINEHTLLSDVVAIGAFEPKFAAVGGREDVSGWDVFLTLTNNDGTLESASTITTPGDYGEYADRIISASGLEVLMGSTGYNPVNPSDGADDMFVIQVKGGMQMVRGIQYHNPGYQRGFDLAATSDGGVVVVGRSEINDPCDKTSNYGVFVMKLDSFLNVEWSKIIQLSPRSNAGSFAINVDTEERIWVAGAMGSQAAFLMSMLNDGTINWIKGYSQPEMGWGTPQNVKSIIPYTTAYGTEGLVLYGQMNYGGYLVPYVINTTKEGETNWINTYQISRNDMYPEKLIANKDGGFAFTGRFFNNDPQADNYFVGYIATLSEDGNTNGCFDRIEMTDIGVDYCENNLELTAYETFTQEKVNPVATHFDLNIATCEEYGASSSLWEEENDSSVISPNPVDDLLTISEEVDGQVALIYNKQGEVIMRMKLVESTIDVSSLIAGVYILRIETHGGSTKTYTFIKK